MSAFRPIATETTCEPMAVKANGPAEEAFREPEHLRALRTQAILGDPISLLNASKLAGNLLHYGVAGFVSGARRKGHLMCHDGTRSFVQAQQLPADRFVARATAADLPNSHYGVVILGEADSVDLDRSGVAVIANFKNMA
jgi:hypothetical protein